MIFKEVVDQFIQQTIALQRSQETVKSYRSCLNGLHKFLVRECNCPVYLDEIKECDLEAYLQYLLQEKHYASKSRQTVVNVLKCFLHYCRSEGLLKHSFKAEIQNVKVEKKERSYLAEKEVQKLVASIDNQLIIAVIQTLYYTGLRIAELAALTLSDVDLEACLITVKAGKGGKDRVIPICDKLKTILKDYLSEVRVNTGSVSYFCSRTGAISKSYITKMFQRVREASGISKEVTFHLMRHSFASSLLRKGVDIYTVQRLLGHSSIKTTGIYLHSNLEDLRNAVNKL